MSEIILMNPKRNTPNTSTPPTLWINGTRRLKRDPGKPGLSQKYKQIDSSISFHQSLFCKCISIITNHILFFLAKQEIASFIKSNWLEHDMQLAKNVDSLSWVSLQIIKVDHFQRFQIQSGSFDDWTGAAKASAWVHSHDNHVQDNGQES